MSLTTKTEQVVAALKSGDDRTALKLAARFRMMDAGTREAVQRGWAAVTNPAFYTDLGQDPERLVQVGLVALRAFYKITDC